MAPNICTNNVHEINGMGQFHHPSGAKYKLASILVFGLQGTIHNREDLAQIHINNKLSHI